MHITMVGTGYVGLVTGTCLANIGNDVTCLDVDPAKVDLLRAGGCPIYEPGLEELIVQNTSDGRLSFTLDKQAAYASAEIIFICVGTPSDKDGRADLKFVLGAASDIGRAIEAHPAGAKPKIIVVKSTVPVGTNDKVRAAIAAQTGKPFYMASNPEFLKEGNALPDFNKPDRVVLGVDCAEAGERLQALYDPFVRNGHPVYVMDIRSAEMVKYAANAMLATKISFINEIANLCESYAADVDAVWKGMTSDSRIGNKFLYPGLGYGGSCFPKDVQAVVAMGQEVGQPAFMLEQVHATNQRQRERFMAKVDGHFAPGGGKADLKGKKIAVWGIAFKPGTDDIREAPSLTLMEWLLERGADICAYDPVAEEASKHHGMGSRVAYGENKYDALNGATALVICTDWPQFKQPDFAEMRSRMGGKPVVFDGRNLWRAKTVKEEGLVYYSVGRAPVL